MILQFYDKNGFIGWCTKQLYNSSFEQILNILIVMLIMLLSIIIIKFYEYHIKTTKFILLGEFLASFSLISICLLILVISIFSITPGTRPCVDSRPYMSYYNNALYNSNADYKFKHKSEMAINKNNIGAINYYNQKLAKVSWINYSHVKLTPVNKHGKALINVMMYTQNHYSDNNLNMEITKRGVKVEVDVNDNKTVTINSDEAQPNKLKVTTKNVNLKPLTKVKHETINI